MATRKNVEQQADQLLETSAIDNPPVPVERIAGKLGARLRFETFEPDVSGMLFREEADAVIAINSLHPKTRQRFTIAHEIGHLLMHPGRRMFVDRSVRIDRRDAIASLGVEPEEIEANAFAAALLMPQPMIETAIKQWATHRGAGREQDVILRLAYRFDVSQQAMEHRLANLGLAMPLGDQ